MPNLPARLDAVATTTPLPAILDRAGPGARFAAEEFFTAQLSNPHNPPGLHPLGAALPGLVRGRRCRRQAAHRGATWDRTIASRR